MKRFRISDCGFRIEGTGRGGRRGRGGEGEEFANEPEQCSSTGKHAKHAENGPLTTDHRPWSRSPVVWLCGLCELGGEIFGISGGSGAGAGNAIVGGVMWSGSASRGDRGARGWPR